MILNIDFKQFYSLSSSLAPNSLQKCKDGLSRYISVRGAVALTPPFTIFTPSPGPDFPSLGKRRASIPHHLKSRRFLRPFPSTPHRQHRQHHDVCFDSCSVPPLLKALIIGARGERSRDRGLRPGRVYESRVSSALDDVSGGELGFRLGLDRGGRRIEESSSRKRIIRVYLQASHLSLHSFRYTYIQN